MKVVSIEPTPSPHSMKINVTIKLPDGEAYNFKQSEDLLDAPDYIQRLFTIKGIINIYRVVDFITVARHPRTPWEEILPAIRETLGTEEPSHMIEAQTEDPQSGDPSFGEVRVFIQVFRGIPMQVKLEDGDTEKRFGLPELFTNAILEASPASPNIIWERKWVENHVRYGIVNDIGQEVVEELSASYDKERLDQLVKHAFQEEDSGDIQEIEAKNKITLETLDHSDWKVRYAALDRLNPTVKDLLVLDKALDDERSSIRRLATAYLGMIEEPEVLPFLYKALQDKAANVRRTAGDCLSDLGFKEAQPNMIDTLTDDNRIVRWRAAMFLYEIGDKTAIPALQEASEDPEFEVRMQIKMALDRIQDGEAAKGSIWHQMIKASSSKTE